MNKTCFCFTCQKYFNSLGIARHRAMHRDKRQDCEILFTHGEIVAEGWESMNAIIIFEGKWKLSKQNSYCARPYGGKFKNPAYVAEQERMIETMRPQLIKQKWKCTEKQAALNIMFFGPSMPCDWDNCGLLTDSMQGKTTTIAGKRLRNKGLVVIDDRQFNPVKVSWTKCSYRKIIVEIEEGG